MFGFLQTEYIGLVRCDRSFDNTARTLEDAGRSGSESCFWGPHVPSAGRMIPENSAD